MMSDEGVQRVGVLSLIPSVLEEFGVEPVGVLKSAGLHAHALDDQDNSISYLEMDRLFEKCVAQSKCAHFGLRVGQSGGISLMGLVGKLMRNAPNVGHSLLDLVSNQQRFVRGATVHLILQGEVFIFGYGIYQNGVKVAPQILDAAIALGANMVRELSGQLPLEVLLSHGEPSDVREYERFFRAPIRFDAELTGLVYPQALLKRKIAQADSRLRKALEREIQSYWTLAKPSLANLIRRELPLRIVTGEDSLTALARRYSIHPRKLRRKLVEEGVNFRDLLQEARFQTACRLLENTRLSFTQIALALGYSQPSVLSRSFRRWSGLSPEDWCLGHRDLS